MALQQAFADPEPWEGRSHDQLKEIVNRGLAGGDDFVCAACEMERRSREFLDAEELAQKEAARIKWRRRLMIWLTISGVGAVGAIAWLILG